jgi:hypothetical protein
MTLAFGNSLCFDSSQRVATIWELTWLNCANSSRRLPSTGEIGLIYFTLINTSPPGDESNWSDDATGASSHTAVRLNGISVTLADHPNSDSIGARCVVTPHNNLGPSPTSATGANSIRKRGTEATTPRHGEAAKPRRVRNR